MFKRGCLPPSSLLCCSDIARASWISTDLCFRVDAFFQARYSVAHVWLGPRELVHLVNTIESFGKNRDCLSPSLNLPLLLKEVVESDAPFEGNIHVLI